MLTVRPETTDDLPFIRQLYMDWKCDTLGLAGLAEPMRGNLLDLQWRAYSAGQAALRAGAERSVLMFEGEAVGWMVVDRSGPTIHLAEIHIAPHWRSHGFGSDLISRLLAEGAQDNRPVTLQVNPFNPARRLYEKLGFVERPLPEPAGQFSIDLIRPPGAHPGASADGASRKGRDHPA